VVVVWEAEQAVLALALLAELVLVEKLLAPETQQVLEQWHY
jgi:hypothetical protein